MVFFNPKYVSFENKEVYFPNTTKTDDFVASNRDLFIGKEVFPTLSIDTVKEYLKKEKFKGFRRLVGKEKTDSFSEKFLDCLNDFLSLSSNLYLGYLEDNPIKNPAFFLHLFAIKFFFWHRIEVYIKKTRIEYLDMFEKIFGKKTYTEHDRRKLAYAYFCKLTNINKSS